MDSATEGYHTVTSVQLVNCSRVYFSFEDKFSRPLPLWFGLVACGVWQAVKLLPKTAYWRLDKQWGEWEPNTTCRYGHHVLKVPVNWGQRRTSPRRRVGRNRLDAIIFGQCDERRRRSRRQLSKVLWISTWVNCCFSPHIHLTAGMAFQSQVKDKLKEQGGAFVLSCAIIVIFPPQGTAPLASICFFFTADTLLA